MDTVCTRDDVSIISWNIQGLLCVKLYSPEFEDLLKAHDIVILQETHLLPDDEDCLAVPRGFYALSMCRKVTGPAERHGGGGIRPSVSRSSVGGVSTNYLSILVAKFSIYG
jgi:hypothetical protein